MTVPRVIILWFGVTEKMVFSGDAAITRNAQQPAPMITANPDRQKPNHNLWVIPVRNAIRANASSALSVVANVKVKPSSAAAAFLPVIMSSLDKITIPTSIHSRAIMYSVVVNDMQDKDRCVPS